MGGLHLGLAAGLLPRPNSPATRLLPRYLLAAPGRVLEDGESSAPYTLGGSGSLTEDPVEHVSGTQALKLTASVGGSVYATRAATWDLAAAGVLRCSLFVHGPALPYNVELLLSSTSDWSRYFAWQADGDGLVLGWNTFHLSRSDFTNNGGDDWQQMMIRLRLRVAARSGETAAVSWDALMVDPQVAPVVLFTFDDCLPSTYGTVLPYLAARRVRATAYLVDSWLGQAQRLTAAQALALQAAGWCLANHTHSHAVLTGLSQAACVAELDTCRSNLEALGLGSGSRHVAYPQGQYNATVLAAMSQAGMASGRLAGIRPGPLWPSDDVYRLGIATVDASVGLATATGWIAAALAARRPLILLFHDVVDRPALGDEWSLADFCALVDACLSAGLLPITIGELLALRSGPLAVPLPA